MDSGTQRNYFLADEFRLRFLFTLLTTPTPPIAVALFAFFGINLVSIVFLI